MNQMISRLAVVSGALALAVGIGCGSESSEPPDVSAADVEKEAREALDVAADYTAEQRQKMMERARLSIDEAKRELTDARSSLTKIREEARGELENAIDRAQRAQDALAAEIAELQQAGADQWATSQKRVSAALVEMEEARREIGAALSGDDTQSGAS